MSVKTCQFCGKALGRIRVGTDDFCSREHRNQFRLRKGMDRLLEANKVASLMRRRENPKQIPLSDRLASSAMAPREMPGTAGFPVPRLEVSSRHLRPALARPGVAAGERATPFRSRAGVPAEHRLSLPKPFPAGKRILPAAPAGSRSRVHIADAPAARLRLAPAAADSLRRDCEVALRMEHKGRLLPPRLVRGGRGQALAPRSSRYHSTARSRQTAAGPRQAAEMEFARRDPAMWDSRRTSHRVTALLSTAPPRLIRLRSSRVSASPRPCAVGPAEPAICLPALEFERGSGRVAAGSAAVLIRPAAGRPQEHACAAMWRGYPRWESLRPRGGGSPPGLAHGGAARIPVNPGMWAETYRLAEVRFLPDASFDCPAIALNGSLAAAVPAASSNAPAGLIEESFNAGLDRWIGDTQEWRLDAAGARPAGLALFQPSLTLSDYDFEFLARIENRGFTFVIRASNLSNYHKVTISPAAAGRYELRRSVVIGGTEEPGTVAPLGETIRAGAAFTIQVRARRNDLAIAVDGTAVAHWTDGRLPAGGIGFLAARGDRARIYWVKLASPGGSKSEAAPRRLPRSIS